MKKSLLHFYLQKVHDGDASHLEQLCAQLADRLVFIPTTSKETMSGGSTLVNVVRISEAHRYMVPIFTDRDGLQVWSAKHASNAASISLLGADLCTVLDSKAWVVVDPGTENVVELQPVMVQKIASMGLADEEEKPAQVQVPPATEPRLSGRIQNLPPKKSSFLERMFKRR